MISRPSSSAFLDATPVFSRAEFASALGRGSSDRSVTDLLAHHLRHGRIRRLARGVFASIPAALTPETHTVDRFLAATRLRADPVIAYRSALELHGCACAPADEVQLMAPGEPGLIEAAGFVCRFVNPPRHLLPPAGVTSIDRHGVRVELTTLERTLVDVFDRCDLAGGADELFQSLELVAQRESALDIDALVGFARSLGNAAAAGALGHWLQCERDRLGIAADALEELRSLAPPHPRYALGAAPGAGRAARGWNVILPNGLVERYFDD